MAALLAIVDRLGPGRLGAAAAALVLALVVAAFLFASVLAAPAEKKTYAGALAVLILAATPLYEAWRRAR